MVNLLLRVRVRLPTMNELPSSPLLRPRLTRCVAMVGTERVSNSRMCTCFKSKQWAMMPATVPGARLRLAMTPAKLSSRLQGSGVSPRSCLSFKPSRAKMYCEKPSVAPGWKRM
ncbi:hypothetical protein D3C76_1121110 [compost metagenome]